MTTFTIAPESIGKLRVSEIPYALHSAPESEAMEQASIFEGPTWVYVGIDLEISTPGTFKTTWIGSTPG